MTYPLLGRIQAPGDVKRLQESELPALCEEIRQFLIERFRNRGTLVLQPGCGRAYGGSAPRPGPAAG